MRSLKDLREDVQGIWWPNPEPTEDIAAIGVFYNEGPVRLERWFRNMRPWFSQILVVLQQPTDEETELAEAWCDVVLIRPKLGFMEPSLNELAELCGARGIPWMFKMDGDELADQCLLASLPYAIEDPGILHSRAGRIPIRNTFQLTDGTVIPGWNEINERLLDTSLRISPVVPHATFKARDVPAFWSDYGAIRQHRDSISEYVKGQLGFYELSNAAGRVHTLAILEPVYTLLERLLGKERALKEFTHGLDANSSEQALGMVARARDPLASWEGYDGPGLFEQPAVRVP